MGDDLILQWRNERGCLRLDSFGERIGGALPDGKLLFALEFASFNDDAVGDVFFQWLGV